MALPVPDLMREREAPTTRVSIQLQGDFRTVSRTNDPRLTSVKMAVLRDLRSRHARHGRKRASILVLLLT